MAARAIWKGVIKIGDAQVPVKLFSAVEDRAIHFRLLHAADQTPVEQRMVHPETNEAVAYRDAARGYPEQRNVLIVLGREELSELEPKESRDIDVAQFIDPGLLHQQWYERPYYLGPDGDPAAYFALVEALTAASAVGLSHWVMRKKEYSGALRVEQGYLVLITLRSADEMIGAEQLPQPESIELNPKELKMAEQLVAMFEDEFDPKAFRDEYRERVLEFIHQKGEGKVVRRAKFTPRKVEESSLTQILSESLKAAKGQNGKARKDPGTRDKRVA